MSYYHYEGKEKPREQFERFKEGSESPIRCKEHRVHLIFRDQIPITFKRKLEAISKKGMLDNEDIEATRYRQYFECPAGLEAKHRDVSVDKLNESHQKLDKLFI